MTYQTPVTLAVDVGGTSIKCAVVDLDGAVHHTERHPTAAERGPAGVVATVLDVAEGLAGRARDLGRQPLAVGVVVPAVVADGVALWSANLGLRDVPLRDLVAERTGLPTALGHDVRAGAMAEARLGAGRTTRRLLFVAVGTGIAGGFVLDGRIDDGAHGAAGEIGHIAVRTGADARECGCGARGCLEAHASAAAIARAYAAAGGGAAAGDPPVGDPSYRPGVNRGPLLAAPAGVTAQAVAALVAGADLVATRVWAEAVEALADGLLIGIALHDPAVVALGGGLAGAGEVLLEPLARALDERRTFHRMPAVVRAELGEDAGCLGAALLAMDLLGDAA